MADGADEIGPNIDASAAGGAPSGPGPGAQPPTPPGPAAGSPIIAALARRARGPQASAPGMGDQANSMNMVMSAIAMLQQALPGLQPGSPQQRDVLKAVQSLSRHAAQGAPAAGVQQTQLQDLLKNVVRNALLQRLMSSQGGQQKPGAGPSGPSPLPGAMTNAPMPSTPLPGA